MDPVSRMQIDIDMEWRYYVYVTSVINDAIDTTRFECFNYSLFNIIIGHYTFHIDGLVQKRRTNSSKSTMLFYINPSLC